MTTPPCVYSSLVSYSSLVRDIIYVIVKIVFIFVIVTLLFVNSKSRSVIVEYIVFISSIPVCWDKLYGNGDTTISLKLAFVDITKFIYFGER
jgi:hypothetical protein